MSEIHDLEEAYREAEEAIRRVEVYTKKVPVPAVNEMRYAGYHALRHLVVGEDGEKAREREKAISHCHRAYYDAQSFLLLILYSKALNIRRGLGNYLHFFAEMTGESYWEMKKRLVSARRFIEGVEKSRSDPSRWERRAEFFKQCEPHVQACYEYVLAYENIREELCCRVDESKRKERRDKVILWSTILAVLIAAVSLVVALG